MEEQSLSRIPFRLEDEMKIRSMAKWMKFIAVLNMIMGGIALVVLGAVFVFKGGMFSVFTKAFGAKAPGGGLVLVLFLVVMLAAVSLVIWLGNVLHQAATFFDLVATTDDADQDYLAMGFRKLKTYFMVLAVLGILDVLGKLTTLLAKL